MTNEIHFLPVVRPGINDIKKYSAAASGGNTICREKMTAGPQVTHHKCAFWHESSPRVPLSAVASYPEISLIFAHGVGSLKELWDVPCPSPTGEPFGPRGGVVPTRSAREALRALLLDVVSIQ